MRTCRPLGILAAHVRRGFTLDGNFEAILDSQTKVHVTAVLDRTAVYEVVGAPVWYGRHLGTLDRFTVDPDHLTYIETKNWNTGRQRR